MVISSFSKYWGMTGWRLGWALVPDDLVAAVDALAGNFALCAPVPAQHAAIAAFTESSYAEAEAAVAEFAARALAGARRGRRSRLDQGRAGRRRLLRLRRHRRPAGPVRRLGRLVRRPAGASEAWPSPRAPDFDPVDGGTAVRVSLAAGPEAVAAAVVRIPRVRRPLSSGRRLRHQA